jgi:pilus assembly protein FimV
VIKVDVLGKRKHMNLRKIAVQLFIMLNIVTAVHAQQGQLKGPKNSSPRVIQPVPQPISRASLPVSRPAPQNVTRLASEAMYGPIVSSDTLWQISQLARQNRSHSIYQVMQAIYELNPDAFEQQNLNLLKDGSMLKLPSESYVANVNVQQARQKAESDSQNFQSASPTVSNIESQQQAAANAETLNQTKELIEKKLGAIDEAQNRQFMAIRKQFAESISSVQNILDENKKLFERLDKVNTDIDEMRSQEQEKSLQMNQMGESIDELLEKSRQNEAEKLAQMEQKEASWLDNPIMLILAFTLPVILILGAFAYWMIKRKGQAPVKPTEEDDVDDLSLDPLAAEMDDLSDALSAELSEEGNDELDDDNLFGDDDLLDDVLAEELEESLDDALEDSIEEPLVDDSEVFDELGDDLLEDEFEEGSKVVEQDDLDSLFDEDDDLLAEVDEDVSDDLLAEIDEDVSDDLLAEVQDAEDHSDLDEMLIEEDEQQVESDVDDMEYEEDETTQTEDDSDDETTIESVVDDEEQPEISIDDLLEESVDEITDTTLTDESEDINEEVLQNLDREIESQNQELDSVTGSLIDELEQVEQMRSMMPDEDEEEVSDDVDPQLDIQKLDDLAEEVDEDLLADDFTEENSDAEVEVDISEVLHSSEQLEKTEESIDTEQVIEAEELVEPEPVVEAEELIESEPVVEAEELVEPEPVVEAEELAEPEPVVQTDELVESEPVVEVEELEEPEPVVEVEELAEPEPVVEAEELVEPEPAVETEEFAESELAAEAEELIESEQVADGLVEPEPVVEPEALAEPEPEVEDEELADLEQAIEEELVEPDLEASVSNTDSILDEDQLEKALEDFEKEELDEVLEDLTSNESSSISSLDDLEFSADDFVVKDEVNKPIPAMATTLDDLESIEDFDDSELYTALDEANADELNESPTSSAGELDDLPGLGAWLGEDEAKPKAPKIATNADKDVIEELEESSFDEILESIDLDDEISETEEDDTGLDIAALLDETSLSEDVDLNEQETEDFLDVEALLNESVDAESDEELDKALDLDMPFEPFVNEQDDLEMIDVDADDGLGAKLDLAHAYIEIGEDESAKELLSEIIENGTPEQISQAKDILGTLD